MDWQSEIAALSPQTLLCPLPPPLQSLAALRCSNARVVRAARRPSLGPNVVPVAIDLPVPVAAPPRPLVDAEEDADEHEADGMRPTEICAAAALARIVQRRTFSLASDFVPDAFTTLNLTTIRMLTKVAVQGQTGVRDDVQTLRVQALAVVALADSVNARQLLERRVADSHADGLVLYVEAARQDETPLAVRRRTDAPTEEPAAGVGPGCSSSCSRSPRAAEGDCSHEAPAA